MTFSEAVSGFIGICQVFPLFGIMCTFLMCFIPVAIVVQFCEEVNKKLAK